MYNTTERELLDLYESIYKEDTETNDLIIQLCESCEYGTDLEDRSEFAQVIIEDDCIFEFLELVADDFGIDIAEILSEEVYLTENKNKALLDVLRAVGMMSGVLKTPAKQAASKAASKATQKVTSKAISGTPRQGRLLTNKGTAQNFTRGRTPFTATDPVPAASSPLPQVKRPAPSAPGQRELNLRTTPGAGRREVASSGRISSKGGSRMGPDGSKGTALPGAAPKGALPAAKGSMTPLKTTSQVGGPLGQRTIPKPGAGLPRQAPKPAWGPGGTGGPGLPKPPTSSGVGGNVVRSNARRNAAQDKASRAAAGTRGTGTTAAYPGPEARNMTVDVGSRTISSRRTTSQFLKDLARAARNNKGKVAAGAAIAGAGALGLATGDGKRTASRDTAPTTPSTPPASKGKTGTGMANIPPGEGTVNNPNYGKPGSNGKADAPKAPESKKPAPKAPAPKAPESKKPETKKPESKGTPKMSKMQRDAAELRAMRKASQKRIVAQGGTPATPLVKDDVDVFEIIKGYLIDEGYAGSEEAALIIMTNMSGAWQDQIIESSCGGHSKKKKKKKGY